jgi:hypothetical protein
MNSVVAKLGVNTQVYVNDCKSIGKNVLVISQFFAVLAFSLQ